MEAPSRTPITALQFLSPRKNTAQSNIDALSFAHAWRHGHATSTVHFRNDEALPVDTPLLLVLYT